eukprot:TRINITY_DN31151_c0_g1_i1.p2 TRINITY_DN31151_c0_g1~~TRINITY_DN31151_c0_g1_i1.p2  ORF type:complete len:108 (-),score=11.69 TRINITY_DN31151_c0_g1_i1:110-433(-)
MIVPRGAQPSLWRAARHERVAKRREKRKRENASDARFSASADANRLVIQTERDLRDRKTGRPLKRQEERATAVLVLCEGDADLWRPGACLATTGLPTGGFGRLVRLF